MGFKMFTLAEAISKAFRENSDKQSGQHSIENKNYFPFDIPAGLQPGYGVFSMEGRNPSINQDESTDSWDVKGDINYLTTDETLYISSTSVSDVGNMVVVQGLDGDYLEQTGIAILNGQNQVEVKSLIGGSITWLRFFIALNNSSSDLVGEAYIAESDTLTGGVPNTSTKIQGKIAFSEEGTSNNRTYNCVYTVPAGKSMTTSNAIMTASRGKDVIVRTQARFFGGTFIGGIPFDIFEGFISFVPIILPRIIPEKTDLKVRLTSNNADTSVSVRIDLLVVDNEVLNNG